MEGLLMNVLNFALQYLVVIDMVSMRMDLFGVM